jgi:hypothetical protein
VDACAEFTANPAGALRLAGRRSSIDDADAVVEGIGDVEVALVIEGDARRAAWRAGPPSPMQSASRAGQRHGSSSLPLQSPQVPATVEMTPCRTTRTQLFSVSAM